MHKNYLNLMLLSNYNNLFLFYEFKKYFFPQNNKQRIENSGSLSFQCEEKS